MNKILEKIYHPTAGLYILHWTLALLMLLHGMAKLQHGIAGSQDRLLSAGLPGFIGYSVLIETMATLAVRRG